MLLVLGLSSLPANQITRLGLSTALVNLIHIPLFAGLAWVTLLAFVGPVAKRVVLTTVFCLIFAVTDEWYQSFVPGRVPALDDVAANAGGIALGIVFKEGLWPVVLAWIGGTRK
jgi:hypothetical protein